MKNYSFQGFLVIVLILSNIDIHCQEQPWKGIGPYMGNINMMVMDDLHPDTIYAGTPYGIFKTVNGAANWTRTSFPSLEVVALEISMNHPNYLIAASDYSVYLSNNYGDSWDTIWSESMKVTSIAFNPENPGSIYVGTNEYYTSPDGNTYTEWMYKSLNKGITWEKIFFSDGAENKVFEQINKIIIDPSDTTKMYVGIESVASSDGCLLVSHNNGLSWTMNDLTGSTWQEVKTMIVTPKEYENHRIGVVVKEIGVGNLFVMSKDHGISWKEYPLPSGTKLSTNQKYNAIENCPDFPEYIFFGAEKENSSVSCFNIEEETWHYLPDTPLEAPTSYITNNNSDYLGFKTDGVFKYSPSESKWQGYNDGLYSRILQVIPYPETPEKCFAQVSNYLFKTTNSGQKWQLIDNHEQRVYNLSVDPSDTSMIVAGSSFDRLGYGGDFNIYISDNGGSDWDDVLLFERKGDFEAYYSMWTEYVVRAENNPEIIYIGVRGGISAGAGVYKSVDNGETWDRIDLYSNVSDFAIDPNDNDIIYNALTKWGYVRRSVNGGESWDFISPSGGEHWVHEILNLAVDNNSQVFALTNEGLFKWGEGVSWSLVEGLQAEGLSSIVIDNSMNPPVYYVSTFEEGVFISCDNGVTWESYSKGIENLNITELSMNQTHPGNLFAGTRNAGVWMTALKGNANHKPILEKPEIQFYVYPNPNKGTFKIISDNDIPLKGSLRIINLLGEVVYSDNKLEMNPKSSCELSISNISPGYYILSFESDKLTLNRAVIIE